MTENSIKYLVAILYILFGQKLMSQPLYFSTPQESVEVTAKLLVEEDWKTLTKYYFVETADNEIVASLENRSYFLRDKKPELVHPAVSWRYKKPFDSNFKYLSQLEEDDDRVKVDVGMEIDQGNGIIQRGMSSFYLVKSESGYQLLLDLTTNK